jgi:hypothetical protein
MGSYKRGHQYWGEKQELLCQQWVSAATQQEFTKIHGALLPQLNQMCEMIMNRYFHVPTAQRQSELKKDAIQELFIKLKHYQVGKSKSGAYSFCGMVIKHFLYEVLVQQSRWKKNVINNFDYSDSYSENAKPIDYGENFQINIEAILSHFQTLKAKVIREDRIVRKKSKRAEKMKKCGTQLEILDLCEEYVNKFGNFNGAGVSDYIYLNSKTNLQKSTISYYFRQLFGLILKVNLELDGNDDLEEYKADGRFSNYFQDDVTPNENKFKIRHMRKQKDKKYGDRDKYAYF